MTHKFYCNAKFTGAKDKLFRVSLFCINSLLSRRFRHRKFRRRISKGSTPLTKRNSKNGSIKTGTQTFRMFRIVFLIRFCFVGTIRIVTRTIDTWISSKNGKLKSMRIVVQSENGKPDKNSENRTRLNRQPHRNFKTMEQRVIAKRRRLLYHRLLAARRRKRNQRRRKRKEMLVLPEEKKVSAFQFWKWKPRSLFVKYLQKGLRLGGKCFRPRTLE